MTLYSRIYALFVLLLLSGCSMIPEFELPTMEMPNIWTVLEDDTEEYTAPPVDKEWWKNFSDIGLNKAIDRALNHNNNLQASLRRIAQSRASLKTANATLLPTLDGAGSASASRSRTNNVSTSSESFTSGLDVAYELDLFGENQAGVAAAEANVRVAEFSDAALKLTVMADTASAYFSLLSLYERLAIAKQSLQFTKETRDIEEAKFLAGRVSSLSFSQQKSAYATSLAALTTTQEQVKNAEHALAILLGRPPGNIDIKQRLLDEMDIPSIEPGLPSELLVRRPDIAQAEMNLVAANANIGAARSAFFPSFNLTSGADITSPGFGDPATTIISLASSISVPIFRGGRLEAGLASATERERELAFTYRQTVLEALQEVEDAIIGLRSANIRLEQRLVALEEAQYTVNLSRKRFAAGNIDFQAVLTDERAFLTARDTVVQAKLTQLNAIVTLYRTLGGGFEFSESAAQPNQTSSAHTPKTLWQRFWE